MIFLRIIKGIMFNYQIIIVLDYPNLNVDQSKQDYYCYCNQGRPTRSLLRLRVLCFDRLLKNGAF